MARCAHCTAEMPEGAKFCPACGEPSDSSLQVGATQESAGPARARRAPSPKAPASWAPLDQARFAPGTTLAERYRIVALAGRGGMGDVYRAEDLKLGQTVALKFLPERLAQDGAALARFHREVRVARQVSHPNVCRVFDIGEADGLPFLTMEYIDGEDLGALLRRIGRVPPEKALEIARQLCAGLAAAHEYRVLHRDLKPSNVMLDGRGKVRITDFGLAGLAGEFSEQETGAGTPAYMAPEQLARREVTVQSDIYSLGLVLYEIFTGRRVFEASTPAELLRLREHSTPASPGNLVSDLDPLVERVILRCLEKEPAKRPASALQVAAALPGGDPLAAALAAGETPSPEMVAAAGDEAALQPRTAWALLGGVCACLLIILMLNPYSTDLGLAPLEKTPDSLADRSRDLVKKFGYSRPPADTAFWLERNYDFLKYRADHLPTPQHFRELAAAEQTPFLLLYRQSPRPLIPLGRGGDVNRQDPPYETSGMVTVVLDSNGRLLSFLAVPPQVEDSKGTWPEPDWEALLAESGLDRQRFKPAEPRWLPPVPFDARAAWNGSYAQNPDFPIHVVAAAYHSKPVYFEVIGPWNRPWRMEQAPVSRSQMIAITTALSLAFTAIGGAFFFARRNIRLGRGDRRGAFRVSAYFFAVSLLAALLGAHHVADLRSEALWYSTVTGLSLVGSACLWLSYMALEPYVRRRWPNVLISWTRLLSGRVWDPLIGRDLLAGALGGAILAIGFLLTTPFWFPARGETPVNAYLRFLGPVNHVVSLLLSVHARNLAVALGTMLVLFVARVLLRRDRLAVAATAVMLTLVALGGENVFIETPFAVLFGTLFVFILLRFGILALVTAGTWYALLRNVPLTLDFSRWYAGRSLFVLLLFAGLAIYAFRAAMAGRPIFETAALDE